MSARRAMREAEKGEQKEMKKRIALPIIVEGKYDKITLDSIFDARVFVSGGFGVFNSKEKQALFRRLSGEGIILLLDSDGGGVQIRSFLNSILPKDKIYNVYIPTVLGKERRKSRPSRSGVLGVEGMSPEVLLQALAPFIIDGDGKAGCEMPPADPITKLDFYLDGLSGGERSAERRDNMAVKLGLPRGMTANALLAALNIIITREDYKACVRELSSNDGGSLCEDM